MVGFEIRAAHNLMKRYAKSSDNHKDTKDLTDMQRRVIGYLSEHEDKDIFQKDLEEEFSVRRSTATGILQLMEKNGLITREPVSYDARLKKIVLTEKAIVIRNIIRKQIEEHEKKLKRGISDEELEVFFNVMKKIRKNLGE